MKSETHNHNHLIGRQLVVLSVGVAILLAVATLLLSSYVCDDAYIHFRIAENYASTGSPYYNTDDDVMSTSAPLWTLILAAFAYMNMHLPMTVVLLNPALTVLGAYAWVRLFAVLRWNPGRSHAVYAYMLYVGYVAYSCVNMMETPLALALIGWGVVFTMRSRRSILGPMMLSGAIFVRYESAVYFVVYAAGVIWCYREPLKTLRCYWISRA